MLTYDFNKAEGPLYSYIYSCIKRDIISCALAPGEKLPSKRSFANNSGVSTITIQSAYDQLLSEGYIYALPRKGYFVSDIEKLPSAGSGSVSYNITVPEEEEYPYDLSSNGADPENFPFSVWARASRAVMAEKARELMLPSPAGGIRELREAIARHLQSFRGMLVDPDQIVIGAGTEYLYTLLVQLLGRDKIYAVEDPGYGKIVRVYAQYGIDCRFAGMDECGVTPAGLHASRTDIAHICPNHHFPTGITMPAGRRYEILSWACENEGRYIIEDDYDSEFRTGKKPVPTLFSIDCREKVIYMNTFSKSLSPTIRISYMILPAHLANRFYKELSFYSCTVSNFEQYTLARFMDEGSFEKHINRMRLFYIRRRKKLMDIIETSPLGAHCRILENDSGLHFLLNVDTRLSDEALSARLRARGVKMLALSGYYMTQENRRQHLFIINYSNLAPEKMAAACAIIAGELEI